MRILLREDLNADVGRKGMFRPIIRNDSLLKIINGIEITCYEKKSNHYVFVSYILYVY
jgi:hypothetical protein